MNKIINLWLYLRTSLWFVPGIIILSAMAGAMILIEVDTLIYDFEIWNAWPLLFGAGADGTRGMLTAIATSMITVAGVVFSITIVALSLASSQYSSRVLRNFMKDRTNQTTLGVIVGVFVYCLVVLRTIRGGDEGGFVPPLASLFALVFAFVGIGFLIYFIHHIASSIQASHILAAVTSETLFSIDHLFPENLGEGMEDPESDGTTPFLEPKIWTSVPSQQSGYIQQIETRELIAFAKKQNIVVRMECGIGEFTIEDTPLVSLARAGNVDKEMATKINALFTVNRQRTIEQDAGFGIRQIVDVALKALSPGINDTTTAVMCVDYLTSILTRLALRRIETPYRTDDGELRVIARGPTFTSLVRESFDQIQHNAHGNVIVLMRLLQALDTLSGVTRSKNRRRVLFGQLERVQEIAWRTIPFPKEQAELAAYGKKVAESLNGPTPVLPSE